MTHMIAMWYVIHNCLPVNKVASDKRIPQQMAMALCDDTSAGLYISKIWNYRQPWLS